MSRRGWKERRAELFQDEGDAFDAPAAATHTGPQRAAAGDVWGEPEALATSDVWGEPELDPASDVWSETPPAVADLWSQPEPAPPRQAWSETSPAPARDVWSEPATPTNDTRRKGERRAKASHASTEVPRASASTVWSGTTTAPAAPVPKRARKPWLATRDEALPKHLVGRDLAGPARRARVRRRLPLPVLAGAIIAALLLVTLRVEILRLRYAAAEVAAEEQALRERIAQTQVRVGALRGPARLRKLAVERGFVRPERVLTVPVPARAADVAAAPRPEARP